MYKKIQKIFKLSIAFGVLVPVSVLIQWNANLEDDVAGYKIHWGTQSKNYDHVVYVGLDTSYTIEELVPGYSYYFAVTCYDVCGNESEFSEEVSIFIEPDHKLTAANPNEKSYNFPNPFNPSREATRLRYYLDKQGLVSINIYDAGENLIRRLVSSTWKASGEHLEDVWDGRSEQGNYVPNGIYYAVIKLEDKREIIFIAVLR